MIAPALRTAPRRIAYVVHTFDMGGLERCVCTLISQLDRREFSPSVICLNRNGTAEQWLHGHDTPIHEIGKNPGNDWRTARELAAIVRRERIELLHSHNWGTLLETCLARRFAGAVRHVHAEHGLEFSDGKRSWWRRWLRGGSMYLGLKATDAVVTVGTAVRTSLAQRCLFGGVAMQTIRNGIPFPVAADNEIERQRVRAELGLRTEEILITAVGRLAPVKRLADLIAAFKDLTNQNLPIRLLLVGGGPEEPALRAQCESLALGNQVLFAGPQQAVGPWLAASDVFVNCSRSEGLSLALLEALAAGLPCVVTAVGDHAEVIQAAPACGIVVPREDVPALSTALHTLVQHPAQRQAFGQAAAARFEREYRIERMTDAYIELYRNLLGSGSAG